MKNFLVHSFLFFACCLSANAQSTDTLKRVDELFSGWNNATPGGAIAISRNGKVLYNKAFGLADLEHNVPNTTETIFESGSVAKQFTAFSILLLETDGKLSIQDDVRKYIPELPTYDAPIKIVHLLNHTSGLKDWGTIGGVAGWERTTKVYTLEIGLDIIFKQKSLNFTPGSEYSYSNSNYTLLTAIVERVSKQTLADFTRTRLFEPLGMTHTKWRNNFREVIPNRAIAYSKVQGGYAQNMPFENIHGHGGLLTTTADLLIWNKILETHNPGGDKVNASRILKGRLNNGTDIHYAKGLFIEKVSGFDEIGHSGATAGYRAWLAWYPKKNLTVVLLSNTASFNPSVVGRQIAELYLGKEKSTPIASRKSIRLSDSDLKPWAGIYKSIRNFDVITLDYKDNAIRQNNNALLASHRDTLYSENTTWIKTKSNQLLSINANDSSSYVRVQPPVVTNPYLQKLTGEYFSPDADATFKILLKDNELWVIRKPGDSFKLNPSFLDGFLNDDMELYEFLRDKQGNITGFTISTSRAEDVPFNKIQKK